MSRAAKQIRNTGALTFAKMLQPLFSFFLIRAIAHEFGLQGHGQYVIVFNYIMIFEIFAAFGMKRLMAREIALDRTQISTLFVNGCYLTIPSAVGAALIMSGLVYALGWSQELLIAAWILAGSLIATSLSQCAEGVYIGLEKMHIPSAIWVVENLIRVAVSIFLVYAGYGLKSLVITYVVVRYGSTFFYFVLLLKDLSAADMKLDRAVLHRLFSSARTFVVIVIFVTIYWKLDVMMLKEIKGDEAVGAYDGAYRFFSIVIMLISNFVLSVFPLFSSMFKEGSSSFTAVLTKTAKYFFLLAVPFAILFFVFTDFLLLKLFNSDYTESVLVLRILIFAIIPYGLTEICAHALLAGMKQKVDMVINGAGMLINMILNFVLIPRYSYYGAAAATLISIHLYLLIQLVYLHRHMPLFHYSRAVRFLLRLLLPSALMVLLVVVLYTKGMFVLTFLTPVVFFGTVWVMGIVSAEDKNIIRGLLKRT